MILMRLNRDAEAESMARDALEIWRQTAVPEEHARAKPTGFLGSSVVAKASKRLLLAILKKRCVFFCWVMAKTILG